MSDTITTPRRGTEAYDLVADLRSNLNGNLSSTYDTMGADVARAQQRDALDAIARTFANPEAAAFLNRHGKTLEDMTQAVKAENLQRALRGMPDVVGGQQERAATSAAQRESDSLFTQAQRDAGRARTEFAQARAAAPPAGASASREPTM